MKVKETLLEERDRLEYELTKAKGEKKVELHEKILRGEYKNEKL